LKQVVRYKRSHAQDRDNKETTQDPDTGIEINLLIAVILSLPSPSKN
jgi:hypothetical protein